MVQPDYQRRGLGIAAIFDVVAGSNLVPPIAKRQDSAHGETFEELVHFFEGNRNESTAHISPARRRGCERASHSPSGVRLIPGETESDDGATALHREAVGWIR